MIKLFIRKLIRKLAAPLGCGLFLYALFQFVFLIGLVPSSSMEPTIREGSFILACRLFGEPSASDVMIFEQDGYYLVKRVAAVPGDTVWIGDNGVVSVNVPLEDAVRELPVPDGHYFMLGDNSAESFDSRVWRQPFVSMERLVAKVWP